MFFFFFNDTATTEIYTLSLHDALPISLRGLRHHVPYRDVEKAVRLLHQAGQVARGDDRSEEHTSELQSRLHLVCRLLLEKKKSAAHPGPVLECPPRNLPSTWRCRIPSP